MPLRFVNTYICITYNKPRLKKHMYKQEKLIWLGGIKLAGLIALVLGFASLIIAFIMEGGHLTSLLRPTAAIIVFGGTIAAVMLSFQINNVKRIGKIMKVAFFPSKVNLPKLIVFFKDLAGKTRKNGLLSIEGEISGDNTIDPFVKKGLQMIVDGVEPQTVRSILELESEMISERHKSGAAIMEAAGGFAPTMGIIGTVMGLVHVLGNLANSKPDALGESIATAFIATLYGVGSANLIWLPLGERLKDIDKDEALEKQLIIEAVLFIQEGINPNTIAEKLKAFLNKKELMEYEDMSKKVDQK